MKKLFLFIAVLALLLILLPLVGNKVAQNELNNRVEVLESYGVKISQDNKKSNFFTTNKHYTLLVEDEIKFVKYLQQFSDNQLPPYTKAMLRGVLVGADVSYSNFPFSDKVSIDIYPLSFSKETMQSIEYKNKSFYLYLKTLLNKKALLYHINYNIVSTSFDGYIKNIDEHYSLEKNSKISVKISDAIFEGEGAIIAPSVLKSTIKDLTFTATSSNEEFNLSLHDFKTTSNFQSQSTYATTLKLKDFKWSIKGTRKSDVSIKGSNIYIDTSSNIQSKKAQLYLKSSFENLNIKTSVASFGANNFNSVFTLKEIDKQSFEDLRVLIALSKVQKSKYMQDMIAKQSIMLLSKGVVFEVGDFSLESFTLKNHKNIKGFKTTAKLVLAQDNSFAKRTNIPIDKILKDITLDAKLHFSKDMMHIIYKEVPLSNILKSFGKEQNDEFLFNIKFKNSHLSINDKIIK